VKFAVLHLSEHISAVKEARTALMTSRDLKLTYEDIITYVQSNYLLKKKRISVNVDFQNIKYKYFVTSNF